MLCKGGKGRAFAPAYVWPANEPSCQCSELGKELANCIVIVCFYDETTCKSSDSTHNILSER